MMDARHAAVVNSDHNTTTIMMSDVDGQKKNFVKTINIHRLEAASKMAIQTDLMGVTRMVKWLEETKILLESMSFDGKTDNIPLLAPFAER